MPIRLTNTLTGREEPFQPRHDPVRLYVCGMTPKFHPHVGHARLFVAIDVIRRYLEYRGYRLKHVQNFTDVDDKIIARANQEGMDPREVARRYSESYFIAMDALNVRRADLYPTVTDFMPQIIRAVQELIDSGHAYVVDGDVYYDVSTKPDYGKLSGRTTEEGQLVGARKELEPGKRDPRDFALWKAAKPGEPAWESPWGPGRPGWHIECSTMSRETLGDQLDMHAGGWDLVFPHHENEIAQSEALTGKEPFAFVWTHIGLVTVGGEKMAHSLGNFTTVAEVLKQHEPMALRLYLITTHYRSPLAFNEESLIAAGRGLARLRAALEGSVPDPAAVEPAWAQQARARFEEAMDDDFNTSGALGHLFDLAREINRRRDSGEDMGQVRGAQQTLRSLAEILGLRLEPAAESGATRDIAPFVELVLDARQTLRSAKLYREADRLRAELRALGIVVEDTPTGSTWRRARPGE